MGLLRTISGRVRSFRAIKSAVNHHGQRVAQKLDGRFNSLLPENLRIDFWSLMLGFFMLLEMSCGTLIDSEHHLVGERGNDKRKQNKRDADAQKVGNAILGFRNAVEGVYDPVNVEEFGFPPQIGRSAFDLLRQGDYLIDTISKPGFSFPQPKYTAGVDLDKELGTIRTLMDDLRLSNAEAEAELKLAQAAKVDKDRAQNDWDLMFPWGGRIITGLFILAGETELARFIVPSTRRAGRTRLIAQQERRTESGESEGSGHGASGDQVPEDQVPGDTVPEDQVPGDTVPEDQVPGDEAPGDEVSGDQVPGDTPAGDG